MGVVESTLREFDGGRVLDVATHEGGFVKTLIENLGSYAAVVGIDLDERFTSGRRKLTLHSGDFTTRLSRGLRFSVTSRTLACEVLSVMIAGMLTPTRWNTRGSTD